MINRSSLRVLFDKNPEFLNHEKYLSRISLKSLRRFFCKLWMCNHNFCHQTDVKIRYFFSIYEFIMLIMNSLKSRYAYSNLNLEFLYSSLLHCTIHFKVKGYKSQQPRPGFYVYLK